MDRGLKVPIAVAALAALAGTAFGWKHILVPGQKAFGVIDEDGEVDEVRFFAPAGASVDFKVKARKGEDPGLLPVVTRLEDPDGLSILGSVPVATNGPGTLVHVGKFIAPKTGNYLLGISGDGGTTGTWDLASKGPPSRAFTGTIGAPGEEDTHAFEADVGTVTTIQVKAASGSVVHPLIARIERPEAAGDQDLTGAARKTSTKKDQVSNLLLGDNGEYGLVVTGADGTTEDYAALLKVSKSVALDFSEDPPDAPPPVPSPSVSSVSPTTFQRPPSGTQAESMTVNGADFQSGATVAITAPSGTNGISNVQASFTSAAALDVTFDLASTASAGARTVTVTNPDTKTGSKVSAFTVTGQPTLTLGSVAPSTGPGAGGTLVLLQGAMFTPATAVTFGSVPARAVNVLDASNILCTVPPAASLSTTAATAVTVTVDNGGGDTATLASAFSYAADGNGPKIQSLVPAIGATGVAINHQICVFVLDEPLASTPVNGNTANFDFFQSGAGTIFSPRVIAAGLGPGNRVIAIQRGAAVGGTLTANATFVPQIQQSGQTSGFVTDVAGNALDTANSVLSFAGPLWQGNFMTGTGQDTVRPTVQSTAPSASATGVDVDIAPSITFSEAVDPSTVAGAVTLKQGVTTVAADLEIDATCRIVTIVPRRKLGASTVYTLGVATTLRDLAVNTLLTAFSANFTTAASDGTAPAQTLTVDTLAQNMNGSGTYASGASNGGTYDAGDGNGLVNHATGTGAATQFDVYLPLSGFTIDLSFSDTGGAGVDPSSFSLTCSAAMGSVGAGQELASFFTVTPMGATWTVDSSHALAAGNNVTFTANVSDFAGNAALAESLTMDVADIARTITNGSGTASTDRDPFNSRQSWLLRFDQDLYTVSLSTGLPGWDSNQSAFTPHSQPLTVTTTGSSNSVSDFEEDLTLVGLNGPQTGTSASTVTNGGATGTKAIVQRLVKLSVRGYLNMRYGMAFDGTRNADSVDIEFLLDGETKSGGGTVTPSAYNGGNGGFSMMSFTGDLQPWSSGQSNRIPTIGLAFLDLRNRSQENDTNNGTSSNNVGVFATNAIRLAINYAASSTFAATFDPLISANGRGGTPVGTDNLDGTVLAGSFNYSSGTTAQKARFDLIMTAIDRYALRFSHTGAHEIGHSTGLVPDGAPPTGLFGNAHPSSPFIATAEDTTTGHIDTAGPNIMQAGATFEEAIATGSDFCLFEPLSLAYLLRRMIYDQ